jgi:hypothetical protein
MLLVTPFQYTSIAIAGWWSMIRTFPGQQGYFNGGYKVTRKKFVEKRLHWRFVSSMDRHKWL